MALSDLLFGSGTASSNTKTSFSGATENAINQLVARTVNESNRPYQAYQGARVAGLTGLENQAIDRSTQLANQASTALQPFTQGWSAETAQQYMNPFSSLVTQQAADELTRQAQMNNAQIGSQAAMSGAFGGSRQALLEAENARNLDTSLAKLYASGNQSAYEDAYSKYQGDLNNISTAFQNLQSLSVQPLAQSGELQRQLNQSNLDLAYQDYLQQQNSEQQNLSFLSSILQQSPAQLKNISTTTTTPTGNKIGQVLGGLSSLSSLGSSVNSALFGSDSGSSLLGNIWGSISSLF